MRFKRGLREAGLFASKVPALSVWEEGDERNLGACMPGLEPNEGEEVITKTHPSAFFGTTLTSRLRFMGIDTLVICGATTSGAVRATASDAMRENYRPMVVGTACADSTRQIHEANIRDLDATAADVVGEDEAAASMRKGWHF